MWRADPIMSSSMLAILCGLGVGLGLFLIWWSMWEVPTRAAKPLPFIVRMSDELKAAGLHRVSPGQLIGVSVLAGGVVFALGLVLTRTASIAACFALFAGVGPYFLVRYRAQKTTVARRTLWPEAIDNLHSGIRAGLSLPEAICGLGNRGPEQLQPIFAVFDREYRATGSFHLALNRFKDAAADPVADRIVAAFEVTREVGGTDLGTTLKTLSHFLREDSRTRSELEARQSWTITGAKLGVAAPWVVLALLSTRHETAVAYNSAQGSILLIVGLVVSVCAYLVMKRIGRLPAEPRVLR